MTVSFSITWDYRCPFARNAHEHLVSALEAGAPWEVTFIPFSLDEPHIPNGSPRSWEDPDRRAGILPLAAGVVVRDLFPDKFLSVHRSLFSARHDAAKDLRGMDALAEHLEGLGVDSAAVAEEIDSGRAWKTLGAEHTEVVEGYDVFGVPTFIAGGRAAFARVMDRPDGDVERARATIERLLDLLGGWPELNEFKHTGLDR